MTTLSERRSEWCRAAVLAGAFLAIWWMPLESPRFHAGLGEALELTRWYAREHVVLCLLPAFFIAGAIAAFVSQGSVMKYLGAGANRVAAYGVASVAGTILAVCSCTVLPLFAGIHRMGAGLGPATAFLYSGPAISALAIVMSAKVLGVEMGLARGIGAVVFAIVIGLLMAWIFRRSERERDQASMQLPDAEPSRPLWQNALFFAAMVSILVFANWGDSEQAFFATVFRWKWWIVAVSAAGLALMLAGWFGVRRGRLVLVGLAVAAGWAVRPEQPLLSFSIGLGGLVWLTAGAPGEAGEWWRQTWSFTKQVMPLLLGGVFVAGLLLGRPGHEGWIPSEWIESALGGNGPLATFAASFAGALMYFATLTEIPIVEGLQGSGMGNGPALALLLAGPALSLPNMLVIRTVIGTRKTLTYVALVVIFSTLAGLLLGQLLPS
ncbi:permease [Haloferula sp. A504]|uniref:permease n=1 Tax=Haloferula sp. A504 TaxID=3373601 RepID=UPI0031C7E63B|nr:permease [Verrucomicrobiaceae bacterium E54]